MPFTRAGCNVGDVSTVNQELENTSVDIPKVFGANSPEEQQLVDDPDSYKDPETADYVGLAVHCAKGNAFCANAEAVKYGQTSPSHTAVPDVLPDEPGGYTGYQALFGHRYIAPQLGAGTPNLTENGYQVTNAAGNLVDLNGNQINGAYLTNHPGFPGFSTHQRLADPGLHGRPAGKGRPGGQRVHLGPAWERGHPRPVRVRQRAGRAGQRRVPATSAQAQYYNQAFGTFFKRLAAAGITPKNTLFMLQLGRG